MSQKKCGISEVLPGISTGGGGVSGATGGSQETNAAVRFGNFMSGGGGGFNPFADPADNIANQLLKPTTLLIVGVIIFGGLYLLKKK